MLELKQYLDEVGQSQLLTFYDELSDDKKEELVNDIKSVDINKMNELYKNSYIDEVIDTTKVSPMEYVVGNSLSNKDECIEAGKDFVKNNKYAVLIMAGGMGSRLGLSMPKGCLELDVNGKKVSLFESYVNQLKKVYKELNVYVNLFVMTSFLNHDATVNYFEEHNYFDYPKDKIHFFTQDKLPILNPDGKILLSDKSHILYGPNGNGNVYTALKNANLIDYLKNNNIEKVLFVTVDNVMSKIVDYSCIGCSVLKNSKLVTKTLFKEDGEKKDWVYCLYDNKPFILPGSYQTDEIKYAQDSEGNYLYRDINITYHIIDTTEIDKYSNIDLKYHRAYKKNKYMDLDGNIIDPVENNSFKFEQFIFDAFVYSDNMLLYRVEKDEFCPIKTQEDIDYASSKLSEEE